jgi:hypothetical protein
MCVGSANRNWAARAIHEAQLLTHMKPTGVKVGLLINFNVGKLKDAIKRFVPCNLRVLRGASSAREFGSIDPFSALNDSVYRWSIPRGGASGCAKARDCARSEMGDGSPRARRPSAVVSWAPNGARCSNTLLPKRIAWDWRSA